jgi:flavin-dependent dehydrogenase
MSEGPEVIVIGAGPAGTTTAAFLADKGRRVIMLEKETFPRYSIGESLIPYCYLPLERLGMVDRLNATAFVKKFSVQFVNRDGRLSQPFYFSKHLDHPAAQTWQVKRSEFDQMLLDNALEKGAEVRQGVEVTNLLREDDAVVGVVYKDADGESHELRAPMTVDASGRNAFAMARNRWRTPDPELKKVAIWTYYKGAKRDPGMDAGATTIAYVDGKGWLWYIPLADDMVSIGVTADPSYMYGGGTRDPKEIFEREVHKNAWVADHIDGAEQVGEYQVTGDFSYRSQHCADNGLVLVGDAFAFLDPVFSSGVFLALVGGEMAAEAIDMALADGSVSAEHFAEYGEKLCHGIEAMRKLVYCFYDESFSFRDVIKAHPHIRGLLTDCLIGHVYQDMEPLFEAVAEFAEVPEPLAYGRV